MFSVLFLSSFAKSTNRSHIPLFVTRRLARSVVKYTGALRLNMPARGSLTGLRCVPQADTAKGSAVAPTMAQLRIRAVGLNFRDVLNATELWI